MASHVLAAITAQRHEEWTHLQKLQPLLWSQQLPASLLIATIDFSVLGVERHFDDPGCSNVRWWLSQRLCTRTADNEGMERKREWYWQENSMSIHVCIGGEGRYGSTGRWNGWHGEWQ